MTIPSYHHLTRGTLCNVSIQTTIEDQTTGKITAKDFKWQEKRSHSADDDGVQLRTMNNVELPQKRGRERNAADNADNMAVVAVIDEGSDLHTQVLCVIRHEQGMLISSPAFNEPEYDDQNQAEFFNPDQGMDSHDGPRMTAYLFQTPGGKQFKYTLELLLGGEPEWDFQPPPDVRDRDSEQKIRVQKNSLYNSFLEEKEDATRGLVHIEIVSAKGFLHPNAIIRGSGLFVRYRILDVQDPQRCLVRGCTGTILPGNFGDCLRFIAVFLTSFTALCLALLLSYGHYGRSFAIALFLSSGPLIVIAKSVTTSPSSSVSRHVNHCFTLMLPEDNNKTTTGISAEGQEKPAWPGGLIMEVCAYTKHNFGLVSLAGCGHVKIPAEPGFSDHHLHTWKPISAATVEETKGRRHDFYLGSCLSEIGPYESLCSQIGAQDPGLVLDGAGELHVRISRTKDFLKKQLSQATSPKNDQHLAKTKETVEEVLLRIRKNKRSRMSRARLGTATIDNAVA